MSQSTKAAIRAIEILAIALSFMFESGTGVLVSFLFIAINELTEFAPIRLVRRLSFLMLEGTVTPTGELTTRLNRDLTASVRPTGRLTALKAPRMLEYKGHVATITVDLPGNGFKGAVPDTDIEFRADLIQDLQQKFEDAVNFYLEVVTTRADLTSPPSSKPHGKAERP